MDKSGEGLHPHIREVLRVSNLKFHLILINNLGILIYLTLKKIKIDSNKSRYLLSFS